MASEELGRLAPVAARGTAGARAAGTLALLAFPGLVTLALGFLAGGYFAGTTGLVAAACAGVIAVRAAAARAPLAGLGRVAAVAAAGLTLLAAWILLSATWSDALSRSLVEFDRALLYLLVFVTMASVPRTPGRLQVVLACIALSAVVLCAAGLLSRTLPDVFPVAPNVLNSRLSYPLTYWNALGLVAAVGVVLCVHFTTAPGPALQRAAGAMALPILAAALILTFSRAGVGVALGGTLVYLAVGRPPALLGALASAGPAMALAISGALDADRLAQPDPTTAAAVSQGHDLIVVVAAAAAGAGVLRLVLSRFDDRLQSLVAVYAGPRLRRSVLGASALTVVVAALVLGGPAEVRRQGEEFLRDGPVGSSSGPLRQRLTEASSQRRILFWRVALRQFADEPLHGSGAGTFANVWVRDRPHPYSKRPLVVAEDAHSLYLETMAELGVPGLAALLLTLLTIAGRLAWLARGPDRAVYAAGLAAMAAWAVHAGVDWDWEVPAVTAWLFGLGGLACARAPGAGPRTGGLAVRVGAVVVCGALATLPLQMAVSQHHLDRGVDALFTGHCPKALEAARQAADALGPRSEPFEVQGLCLARLGRAAEAERSIRRAIDRDPGSWAVRYEFALVRATLGLDPRPALREAARLNPYSPLVLTALRVLRSDRPAVWRRRAPKLVIPGPYAPR